jgi:hypothetical protein
VITLTAPLPRPRSRTPRGASKTPGAAPSSGLFGPRGLCRGPRRNESLFWTHGLAIRDISEWFADNINLKFTGLTQNLGQLEGSYRDFQSNCWVNLRILSQPCEFYLISARRNRARMSGQ